MEETIARLKDNIELCKALMDQLVKDLDALQPEKKEAPPEKKLTLPEVRAVLAEKARAGKTAEVKALLTSLGYQKLSNVPEEKYPELMKKAEEL